MGASAPPILQVQKRSSSRPLLRDYITRDCPLVGITCTSHKILSPIKTNLANMGCACSCMIVLYPPFSFCWWRLTSPHQCVYMEEFKRERERKREPDRWVAWFWVSNSLLLLLPSDLKPDLFLFVFSFFINKFFIVGFCGITSRCGIKVVRATNHPHACHEAESAILCVIWWTSFPLSARV